MKCKTEFENKRAETNLVASRSFPGVCVEAAPKSRMEEGASCSRPVPQVRSRKRGLTKVTITSNKVNSENVPYFHYSDERPMARMIVAGKGGVGKDRSRNLPGGKVTATNRAARLNLFNAFVL